MKSKQVENNAEEPILQEAQTQEAVTEEVAQGELPVEETTPEEPLAESSEQQENKPQKGRGIRRKGKKHLRELPSVEQLKEELHREKHKKRYQRVLRSTVYTLVVIAAVAVLVATIWVPVIQIYGSSMSPTLKAGDIVATVKTTEFESGDLICFYIGNKLLVKRYIAGPGQWVNIDENGNVYVDNKLLDEPYISEKALGDCNIELPYQVPENRIFCLGDQRKTSLDSRHTAVGCISDEQIVGKIFFRVWPLNDMGFVDSQEPVSE